MTFVASRQSIVIPALMLSAWLVFRVTAHLGANENVEQENKNKAQQQHLAATSGPSISKTDHEKRARLISAVGAGNSWSLPVAKAQRKSERHKQPAKAVILQTLRPSRAALAAAGPRSLGSNHIVQLDTETRPTTYVEPTASLQQQAPMIKAKPESAAVNGRRLEGSAWLFLRSNGLPGVSSGSAPTLGGPQVGIRLNKVIARIEGLNVGATTRVSAPLGQTGGKDVSAGFSIGLEGVRGLRLLLERRLPLDTTSRSSWSALASYGAETKLGSGQLKARLYAETGATHGKQTNPFAYVRLQIARPVSNQTEIGIEMVADAQRNVRRADLGPVISMRPDTSPNLSFSAAWRLRVAGNAQPKSGPTFTVSKSF